MKAENKVVEQLNRLLAFELTSIDQYTSHSRQYEDMGLMNQRNVSIMRLMMSGVMLTY